MQAKGLIKVLIFSLLAVCFYQLFYFALAKKVEGNALAAAKAKVATLDTTKVKADSIGTLVLQEKARYLDSLGNKPVYNFGLYKVGYPDLLRYQINLGLDLQGGMSMVLQVSVKDMLKNMSNDNKDPKFLAALEEADKASLKSADDYITLFAKAYQKQTGNTNSMNTVFATRENSDVIKFGDNDEKVLKEIRKQADGAVEKTYEIIRSRIDGLGVSSPNISKQAGTNRILIELPGIDNPERARAIVQSQAKLEFWETWENKDASPFLSEANKLLAAHLGLADDTTKKADTTAAAAAIDTAKKETTASTDTAKSALDLLKSAPTDTAKANAASAGVKKDDEKKFPLVGGSNSVMFPALQQSEKGGQYTYAEGCVVAKCYKTNRAKADYYLNMEVVKSALPKDMKLLWSNKADDNGMYELYAIKTRANDDKAPLTGDVISDANSDLGQRGEYEVTMKMNEEGAQTWKNLTRANIKKFVAIVIDDQVLTAPRVNEEIPGGNSQITGRFSAQEAKDLASIIKAGKLPAPANIVEEEVVGGTLSGESARQGVMSLVIGFFAVVVFMIFYYSSAGIIANIALLLNLIFIAGALSSFQAALTLPGMAGIVLTIGMAVDANVVIFERIREELERGKGLKLAIADGFSRSYSAIIDANVTTLVTGFILLYFGLGPVKGFAVILVIGIISSMITAVLVSRLLMDRATENEGKISFYTSMTKGLFKHINFDFIGQRKITYTISSLIVVVGLASMIFRGFEMGVDFTGGRTYDIVFDKTANTGEIATRLEAQFDHKAPSVKTFGGAKQVRITTSYLVEKNGKEYDSLVQTKLYAGLKDLYTTPPTQEAFIKNNILKSMKVGASIANDILSTAVMAGGIAIVFIFLYIFVRFRRYQYGAGAVVATLHDAFVILALFSLLKGLLPFSLEIDQHFIAAILTIIGYSINDTVIVFDRIREYFHEYPTKTSKEIANLAINHTLSRTIMTSFTVFLVVFILFVFGGHMIRGFAFALLVGVLVGTYSSIFIAAPVVVDLAKDDKQLKY